MSNIAKVDAEKYACEDAGYKRMWRAVDAKCQALFNKQSGSTKAADFIREQCGRLFKIPNATRWGSRFFAYERLKDMLETSKDRLGAVMDNFGFRRFSDEEFHFIQDYITVFDPFVRALNVFQGETNTYIGVLLPVLTNLKKTLHSQSMNNRSCKALAAALIKGIDTRFSADFVNDNFYIAAGWYYFIRSLRCSTSLMTLLV